MFILSFLISLILYFFILYGIFAIKPIFIISLFTNSYLFAGIPIFILVILLDYILIKSIFVIDKRKNDLPPSLVNIRLISGYIIVFILSYLLIFLDKFINILLTNKAMLPYIIRFNYLKYLFIHANFILIFLFFIIFYSFSFILKRSIFANFFKNKLFPIFLLILLFVFVFVFRWQIGSNVMESVINPTIKIKYFESNLDKVNEKIKPLFYLRAAEFGFDIARKNNDEMNAKKYLDYIDQAMKSEKFAKSIELWNLKLRLDIFLKNDSNIISDYNKLFNIVKISPNLLRSFTKVLLSMEKPAVLTVYKTLNKYSSIVQKDSYLKDTFLFLEKNMENDINGLQEYYIALNETILNRKEKLLLSIINNTNPYKVKDDAYYQYIKLLIKENRKREALKQLILFVDEYPNSEYLKELSALKSEIKYTRKKGLASNNEIYCYAIRIDNGNYIISNLSVYSLDLNSFYIKKLFDFNDNSNLVVENVFPIDKYLWIFYQGGRIDVVNFINRDFHTVLKDFGTIYKTPFTTDGKKVYVGTNTGIVVFSPDGKKLQIIDKQNDLNDIQIRFLKYTNGKLWIGTKSSIAIFNLKTMNLEVERNYKDPRTYHQFRDFEMVYVSKNFLYGIGDLGMVKFNLKTYQWEKMVFSGLVKLVGENKKYIITLISDKGNNYRIVIFNKKTENIEKEITDFPLQEMYTLMKVKENNIYIANAEKEVLKISLNNYNFEKYKGNIEANSGEIAYMEILNDFFLILQHNDLTFVYLKVK